MILSQFELRLLKQFQLFFSFLKQARLLQHVTQNWEELLLEGETRMIFFQNIQFCFPFDKVNALQLPSYFAMHCKL